MFWRKKAACPRCDGPLRTHDQTVFDGVRVCEQCALTMAGESLPGDTGPEIDAFLKRTLQSISLKCDVDPILFTARCQGIAGSDVEIRLAPRGYEVMFYTGLLTDPEQTQLTIDYVANWVKENPLKIEPLKVKRVGAQTLAPGNVFAFLFIPASRPLPSDADIEFMERQIAPVRLPGRFGWLICSQPYDETSANKPFVAETIQAWFAEQSDGDSILVAPTPVETEAGRKLNCLLAYRKKK